MTLCCHRPIIIAPSVENCSTDLEKVCSLGNDARYLEVVGGFSIGACFGRLAVIKVSQFVALA